MTTETKPKIFVIMPFGDTFFEAYEMIKNHFVHVLLCIETKWLEASGYVLKPNHG